MAGSIGPQGSSGADGTDGAAGTNGTNGTRGADGTNGTNGANGTNGTNGTNGAVGPAGTNGLAEYAYIYNVTAQTVPIEGPINFDTNGVRTPGITHVPPSPSIGVTTGGDYKVSFSVSGLTVSQMALFLNGAPVAGTTYGSGDGVQQNTGQAIVAIAPSDVLTLRNHSSAAGVPLQTLAGGSATTVNASIVIEKLAGAGP